VEIAEDAMTVACVASNPLVGMPGHTLVITRRHAETIFDLRPEAEPPSPPPRGRGPGGPCRTGRRGRRRRAEPVPRLALEERVRLAESLRRHWPARSPATR
jgi:hypothetical protein